MRLKGDRAASRQRYLERSIGLLTKRAVRVGMEDANDIAKIDAAVALLDECSGSYMLMPEPSHVNVGEKLWGRRAFTSWPGRRLCFAHIGDEDIAYGQ